MVTVTLLQSSTGSARLAQRGETQRDSSEWCRERIRCPETVSDGFSDVKWQLKSTRIPPAVPAAQRSAARAPGQLCEAPGLPRGDCRRGPEPSEELGSPGNPRAGAEGTAGAAPQPAAPRSLFSRAHFKNWQLRARPDNGRSAAGRAQAVPALPGAVPPRPALPPPPQEARGREPCPPPPCIVGRQQQSQDGGQQEADEGNSGAASGRAAGWAAPASPSPLALLRDRAVRFPPPRTARAAPSRPRPGAAGRERSALRPRPWGAAPPPGPRVALGQRPAAAVRRLGRPGRSSESAARPCGAGRSPPSGGSRGD